MTRPKNWIKVSEKRPYANTKKDNLRAHTSLKSHEITQLFIKWGIIGDGRQDGRNYQR